MKKSDENVCGCGCGFRSTIQPLLRLHEMVVNAEKRKAQEDADKNDQKEVKQ